VKHSRLMVSQRFLCGRARALSHRAAWAICDFGNETVALTRLRHTGLPLTPRLLITRNDVKRGKPTQSVLHAGRHPA